jgi:hypothetical protein
MTETSLKRIFGYDYSKKPVFLLHWQPSIKSPWMFTPSFGGSVTSSLKYDFISVLNIRVSIAMWVRRAYVCMVAVINPCGKKKAEAQYEFMLLFSTHCLKNATL